MSMFYVIYKYRELSLSLIQAMNLSCAGSAVLAMQSSGEKPHMPTMSIHKWKKNFKKHSKHSKDILKKNHTKVHNVHVSSQAGHIKTHMRIDSWKKPHKCPQCPYVSSRAGNLKIHLMQHSGEKSN